MSKRTAASPFGLWLSALPLFAGLVAGVAGFLHVIIGVDQGSNLLQIPGLDKRLVSSLFLQVFYYASVVFCFGLAMRAFAVYGNVTRTGSVLVVGAALAAAGTVIALQLGVDANLLWLQLLASPTVMLLLIVGLLVMSYGFFTRERQPLPAYLFLAGAVGCFVWFARMSGQYDFDAVLYAPSLCMLVISIPLIFYGNKLLPRAAAFDAGANTVASEPIVDADDTLAAIMGQDAPDDSVHLQPIADAQQARELQAQQAPQPTYISQVIHQAAAPAPTMATVSVATAPPAETAPPAPSLPEATPPATNPLPVAAPASDNDLSDIHALLTGDGPPPASEADADDIDLYDLIGR